MTLTLTPQTHFFIVAGETSGDVLGAGLMAAVRARIGADVTFKGVGGLRMRDEGLESLFPISDIAVMGLGPVLARLPLILRRIRETAAAAIAFKPDVVVLIDSPDFTHRVAARIRRVLPDVPIAIYVSPTVWFWRPQRAPKLKALCDRLLALLPFEPEVHAILGGPPTTYVGHPFILKRAISRSGTLGRLAPLTDGRRPHVLVLPGSRRSEVRRLTGVFGAALGLLQSRIGDFDLTLPVVEHVRDDVERAVAGWPVQPVLVAGDAAKLAAFAAADVALAASGTATLELSLSGVPTVAVYRLDWIGRIVKHFLKPPPALEPMGLIRSAQLTNIIVGDQALPEFIDAGATPDVLAAALLQLLTESPERARQAKAFAKLDSIMQPGANFAPNDEAAKAVIALLAR
jgi:lipid-A-disaccharide synthase